ncbi:glucan endo-1,3-beta-glucosidase, acidic-like [Daucus carota subsp. sativus]|uniref:glucan endo-1,3-beta-glucosidase, acidic-like n=1 Tax=Daucus carota subsp. sativus TaxID=79200 RepID=UPI003083C454
MHSKIPLVLLLLSLLVTGSLHITTGSRLLNEQQVGAQPTCGQEVGGQQPCSQQPSGQKPSGQQVQQPGSQQGSGQQPGGNQDQPPKVEQGSQQGGDQQNCGKQVGEASQCGQQGQQGQQSQQGQSQGQQGGNQQGQEGGSQQGQQGGNQQGQQGQQAGSNQGQQGGNQQGQQGQQDGSNQGQQGKQDGSQQGQQGGNQQGQQGGDQQGQTSQQGGSQQGQQQGGSQQGQGQQGGSNQGQQGGSNQSQQGQQGGSNQNQQGQQQGQQAGSNQCQQGGNQQGQGQQSCGQQGAQPVGICYGTFADNQPTAQEAISLIQSVGIQRMRLYGPDHNALQSLRNTRIEVVIGVPNEQLQSVASSQDNANQWVQDNIKNYQEVNFRYVVVGNGITPAHDQTSQFAQFVLQAMQNIQNAISACGFQNKIRVTTAIDQSEILIQSCPPSQGQFRPEVRQFIDPIIQFLVNNNNVPLLVNLHPYFSYVHNKADIPSELDAHGNSGQTPRLEYATFQRQDPIIQDGPLGYTNVFDAMVDSVHSALEKAGGSSLDVVVSEIGWPTEGGDAATIENASTHNNKLINHVLNNGTPKRPQKRIETYIFNLFDENKRDSEEFERHWGVFNNNKEAKYQLSFQF